MTARTVLTLHADHIRAAGSAPPDALGADELPRRKGCGHIALAKRPSSALRKRAPLSRPLLYFQRCL
jgi:hypothetical protein